jgi:hypothetical protein
MVHGLANALHTARWIWQLAQLCITSKTNSKVLPLLLLDAAAAAAACRDHCIL